MTILLAPLLLASAIQANSAPTPSRGDAAEWTSAIVLAVTAIFIAYQGWETRRAAQATRDSVAAIKEQAKIMERQTVAAEQAAQAAKDGTAALANIERAWVDVKFTRRQLAGMYILEIANIGRTVAHIRQVSLFRILTPAGDRVVFEPADEKRFLQSKLLVPNSPWSALIVNLPQELGDPTFQKVRRGEIQLHFRAVVRYGSTSADCESECLYYWNNASNYDGLVPVESPESNKRS